MARPLRTFVALCCGPGVVRALQREAERLAAIDHALRAPRTDDFHLTLQFLGDTAEEDLAHIGRALEAAAADVAPAHVAYEGLGAFPSPERARVVWAGVREEGRDGAPTLTALADAVGERLGDLGYPPEARAWHPHVTLGRVRRRPSDALADAVREGAGLDLGGELLSEVKLILSKPGGRGYSYITLTTVDLGGGS